MVSQNDAYTNGDVPRITPQLSYSFEYDANKETFLNEIFTVSSFEKAHTRKSTVPLYPRPAKKLEILPPREGIILSQGVFRDCCDSAPPAELVQKAFLSFRPLGEASGLTAPVKLPCSKGMEFHAQDGDGIYLIADILEEDTGYIYLDIELKKSARILIAFGEHLDDMRVRANVGGRNFCAVYTAKPGRQQFFHPLRRIGLRYMQLHIYADEATIYYMGIRPVHYPVSRKPFFRCDDSLHTKIYEVGVRTLLLCMHEHHEDCPWREQALYSMDSRTQMLCGYYCFGEFELAKASIRLMALSLRDDNMLELCSPAKVGITIPSFSAIFVTQLYEYLLYSRDLTFAEEILPAARAIADGFLSRVENGIGLLPCYTEAPYWNFYEWQEGLDGGAIFREKEISKTYDAPLCAFVSLTLDSLSKIYAMFGNREQSLAFEDRHRKLNGAINKVFWDDKAGAYASFYDENGLHHYSGFVNALIVCCGACPDARLDSVLEKLTGGSLLPVTLSHCLFKYEALMKRPALYADFVWEDIARVWGKMLFSGATTFWETEKGAWDFENAGSLCHGWSAVPVYMYFAYVLGIKPRIGGGYDIHPVKSRLHNPHGRILKPDGTEINL